MRFRDEVGRRSILGVGAEPRTQDAFQCSFVGVGFTNNAPDNKQVSVKVWFWLPQPKVFAETKQGVSRLARVGMATDIQSFAHAALWFWAPVSGGKLYAYKGGTVGVEITVAGLPEDRRVATGEGVGVEAARQHDSDWVCLPRNDEARRGGDSAADRVRGHSWRWLAPMVSILSA